MKTSYQLLCLLFLVVSLAGCGNSTVSTAATARWKSAGLLATSARYQQTGIDAQGNIIAVWAEPDGFFANRFSAGTGWGTPQKVGESQPGWSDLHLAVSKNGHAVIVWLRDNSGPSSVQAVRYSPTNGWGPVEDLGDRGAPSNVAITDAGAAIIVGSLTTGVSVSRYRQDTGWFFNQLPYAEGSSSFGSPHIGLDDSGMGFVLWTESSSNRSDVMVSLCSATGLGSPELIASSQGTISHPVLVSQNRNVMVLWAQSDTNSGWHTYAKYYAASHGWDATVKVDNSLFDCLGQSVTVDSQGNYYAIWSQGTAGPTRNIVSARYLPSSGWQPPELVSTTGIAVSPQIAADTTGALFAAWQEYDPNDAFPGDARVYSSRYTQSTGWSLPQQLKNEPGGADVPTLEVDSVGHATVLWSQSVASSNGSPSYAIYYSTFN